MQATARHRQQGMTFIGWLLVLSIAGFFAAVTLKLVPVYLEHYSIRHVLAQFKDDRDLEDKSPSEIRKLMAKRLKINGVYGFDVKNHLLVEREKKQKLTLRVKYEVRKPMLGNVDLLIHFDDAVDY